MLFILIYTFAKVIIDFKKPTVCYDRFASKILNQFWNIKTKCICDTTMYGLSARLQIFTYWQCKS